MDKETDKSSEIRFKKKVTELKIPENCDALPAKEEKTVEFILKIE